MTVGLSGAWKIITAQFEMADTGELVDMYGPAPVGWLMLTDSGRMSTLLMRSDRENPKGDTDLQSLFKTMMAYTGAYRLEGNDRIVITVDAAWYPGWIGTEQTRYYKLDKDTLLIRTAKDVHPAFGDRQLYGVLRWSRA